jgi:hypothetical protein
MRRDEERYMLRVKLNGRTYTRKHPLTGILVEIWLAEVAEAMATLNATA